jgi:DNA-binding protein H-NS
MPDVLERCRIVGVRRQELAAEREEANAEVTAAVRAAVTAGHSYRTVAAAAGLSHQRVADIVTKGQK